MNETDKAENKWQFHCYACGEVSPIEKRTNFCPKCGQYAQKACTRTPTCDDKYCEVHNPRSVVIAGVEVEIAHNFKPCTSVNQ